MKGEAKKERNANRHAFLRTLFNNDNEQYAIKRINGFDLVRQFNKLTNRWEVAIWSPGKLKKAKDNFKKIKNNK